MLKESQKTDYMKYLGDVNSLGAALDLAWIAARPGFETNLSAMLDDLGLAARLIKAKTKGTKAPILILGCDNGLPSIYIAQLLAQRGLLEASEIITIDSVVERLTTAQNYAKQLEPALPQLQFYYHDLAQPLSECLELRLLGVRKFDMIFSFATQHLPNAEMHIREMYQLLKPGGVIQLAAWFLGEEGPHAWVSPHPAMTPLLQAWLGAIAQINPGVEVSTAQTEWLRECGAEDVTVINGPTYIGGEILQGPALMRMAIAAMINFGPEFIQKGLITKKEYDITLSRVFREVTKNDAGYIDTIITLAHKPGALG